MKLDLNKEDLINLIWGTPVHQTKNSNKVLRLYGYWHEMSGVWNVEKLKKLEESELYDLFLKLKKM